jgi:hypothetical protein
LPYRDEPVARMPTVDRSEVSIERLDALRVDDETDDELVSELVSIDEAEEPTLVHAGDG